MFIGNYGVSKEKLVEDFSRELRETKEYQIYAKIAQRLVKDTTATEVLRELINTKQNHITTSCQLIELEQDLERNPLVTQYVAAQKQMIVRYNSLWQQIVEPKSSCGTCASSSSCGNCNPAQN